MKPNVFPVFPSKTLEATEQNAEAMASFGTEKSRLVNNANTAGD